MRLYRLEKNQLINLSIDKAWKFFSDPRNLAEITPGDLGFKIQYISGDEMYPGMIIEYTVKPFPFFKVRWVTEITQVKEHVLFIDEQRFGPYRFWHHQHKFIQRGDATEIIDIVNYVMPFGIFGRIAHSLFVKRQLGKIFSFRSEYLAKEFGLKKT